MANQYTNEIRIKRVKNPKDIPWINKTFRYINVLKEVKKLKVGQALEVNVADNYMVAAVRKKCYQQQKGNYTIKGRVLKKANKTYIMKASK